jgi:hypothetical protein
VARLLPVPLCQGAPGLGLLRISAQGRIIDMMGTASAAGGGFAARSASKLWQPHGGRERVVQRRQHGKPGITDMCSGVRVPDAAAGVTVHHCSWWRLAAAAVLAAVL